MKRTNLVLDDQLLRQATLVLGCKTYSAAVNYALAEMVRLHKVGNIAKFHGSGIWQGDLAEMREDRPKTGRKRTKK
jgi:Arc/MetJ family transcription regulator